jgi:hypothetical protein
VATSEFSNWWTVGTALANAIDVPRTTLISAVDAGHIPWRLLGSGEPVVLLADARKWAEGRR